jgi:hypothetical protein
MTSKGYVQEQEEREIALQPATEAEGDAVSTTTPCPAALDMTKHRTHVVLHSPLLLMLLPSMLPLHSCFHQLEDEAAVV